MKKLFEKKLSSRLIFSGKVVELYEDQVVLENDKTATREVVRHPGGVCIVPLGENNEVYMVRQFRYPMGKVLEEIPAGKLNYGEDPLSAGKRELSEEIGATAENFLFLGELYPTPAYDTEIIHMYLATGLSFSKQHLDEDEFLEVFKIPLDLAVEKILSGEIKDAKTQTAILKTASLLGLKR